MTCGIPAVPTLQNQSEKDHLCLTKLIVAHGSQTNLTSLSLIQLPNIHVMALHPKKTSDFPTDTPNTWSLVPLVIEHSYGSHGPLMKKLVGDDFHGCRTPTSSRFQWDSELLTQANDVGASMLAICATRRPQPGTKGTKSRPRCEGTAFHGEKWCEFPCLVVFSMG